MNNYLRFSAVVLCVAMGNALKTALDPKEPRDLAPMEAKVEVPGETMSKHVGQMNGTASFGSGEDGWHKEPRVSNRKIYGFVHIPKVAGTSFAIDSTRFIPDGDGYFSAEKCPSGILDELSRRVDENHLSGMSFRLLTFLRDPTAHVQSQYLEMLHDDDWKWVGRKTFLRKCPNISAFLDRFTSDPGKEHPEHIGYYPRDMQTRSLVCESLADGGNHGPRVSGKFEIDTNRFQQALKNVDSYTFVGIVEFYQASMCIFHDKVQPGSPLPDFCDCGDEAKWSSFPHNHVSHHVPGHSSTDLSQEDRQKAATLTEHDQKIYKAGLERFHREVRELEKRRGLRIHCE